MMLLACMDNGERLVYENFGFYIDDGKKHRLLAKIDTPLIRRLLGRWRLANRLLRLEPRCAAHMGKSLYVVAIQHEVWLIDTEKGGARVVYVSRKGWSDPLNFCSDGTYVYWGDYGGNACHDEVRLYKMGPSGEVATAYVFPKNSIRHIHNVVWDKGGRQFYILAGDNEPCAGIYRASCDFSRVEPWKTGQQNYRAVVGFAHSGGLLYATDSVEYENHLRIIQADGIETTLSPLNGSVIYGTETKDHFVFSTTVEPEEGGGVGKLLSQKLGGGINSREVHVVAVNKVTGEISIVDRLHKDWLPMKLFQYGVAKFPAGQEGSNLLCYQVTACRGDGKLKEKLLR